MDGARRVNRRRGRTGVRIPDTRQIRPCRPTVGGAAVGDVLIGRIKFVGPIDSMNNTRIIYGDGRII